MPRDPQSLRKPPTSSFVRRNDFLFWLAIIWLVGWAIAMVGTPLLQPIPAAPQILADPPPAAPKKASEMEQAVVQAFSKRGMHGVLYPIRCRRACGPAAFAADQRSACVRADQPRQATSNACAVRDSGAATRCRNARSCC